MPLTLGLYTKEIKLECQGYFLFYFFYKSMEEIRKSKRHLTCTNRQERMLE